MNFTVELCFVGSFEWECAGQQSEEQDSKSPHINLPAVVLVLPDQFRRHVAGRSTEDAKLLGIGAEGSESEVNDFDHVGLIFDENIIQFNVSVGDPFVVKVVECLNDLLEESATGSLLDLTVGALLLDILVQRDASNVVCDDADLFAGLDEVIHFDDVRVVNLFQRHDFSLHSLSLHRIVQLYFLVNFDSVFSHVELVVAHVNCRVGALPDGLANLVLVKDVAATLAGSRLDSRWVRVSLTEFELVSIHT